MLGVIDQAVSGVNAGFARLEQAGGRIARRGADYDQSDNLVELTRADHEVRANMTVMRTADAMIGSLLDVLA